MADRHRGGRGRSFYTPSAALGSAEPLPQRPGRTGSDQALQGLPLLKAFLKWCGALVTETGFSERSCLVRYPGPTSLARRICHSMAVPSFLLRCTAANHGKDGTGPFPLYSGQGDSLVLRMYLIKLDETTDSKAQVTYIRLWRVERVD